MIYKYKETIPIKQRARLFLLTRRPKIKVGDNYSTCMRIILNSTDVTGKAFVQDDKIAFSKELDIGGTLTVEYN